MDGEAAGQAAGETGKRPRGGHNAARWQAIKHAHPGAVLTWENAVAGVRMVRGRLAPGQPWTPWSLDLNKTLTRLEQMMQDAARPDTAVTG